jgi:hypothetical protein
MEWGNKLLGFILTRSRHDRWRMEPAAAVYELVHGIPVELGWLARCRDGNARCIHPDHLRLERAGSWRFAKHSLERRIRATRARRARYGTTQEHIDLARNRNLPVLDVVALTGKSAHFVYKQRSLDAKVRREMRVAI